MDTAAPIQKTITGNEPTPPAEKGWLDIGLVAKIEVTSENATHPIDDALIEGQGGWSAAQSGEQTIRLVFNEPQKVEKIRLVFNEVNFQRTQEFVLRWSADGSAFQEIVRQQYNFNPPATEVEEYEPKLENVRVLELKIIPDISGGAAIASLAEFRVR